MSCCNGNCGCGSSCKCDNGCSGCKMYADLSYTERPSTTATLIAGLAPKKSFVGGFEAEAEAAEGGCKCGANCTCDPCNCK
ncbi:Metallothionein-like protein [Drosera capensis]